MPIVAYCSSCGNAYEVSDLLAGKTIKCNKCDALVRVPAKSTPQAPGHPDDSPDRNDDEGAITTARAPRWRRKREYEEDDDDYPSRRHAWRPSYPFREDNTDAPGVISLIFGCLSVVCMLMGCFTCGLTYGQPCPSRWPGLFSVSSARGNLRVAGVTLNLIALIPSVILLIIFQAGLSTYALYPRR
jgi:hypothetical protein